MGEAAKYESVLAHLKELAGTVAVIDGFDWLRGSVYNAIDSMHKGK